MKKKYEIRINYVNFEDDKAFIGWSAKGVGFGVLSIYWNDVKDMYEIETECMGKEFCKQVLNEAQKYILHKSIIIE